MKTVRLSEACHIISGGTPKTNVPEYWNGGIGWLSVVDFNNDERFVYNTEKTITDLGVEKSNTKFLEVKDIIISARGTVGALAQVGCRMCFNQSCFGLRGKEEVLNTDFLYYWLKNYVSFLKQKSQGSVFETINLQTFDDIYLGLPNIDTQTSIANILSTLDSKIALNKKINTELEAFARTIYDYWFVQFDFPACSKGRPDKNGKPYKSSGGKMVYNEVLKREVPEGWEVKELKELYTENDKSKIKVGDAKKTSGGEYPFFTSGAAILKYSENFVDSANLFINTGGNADVKYYYGKAAYSTDTYSIKSDCINYLYNFLITKISELNEHYFAGSSLKHLQKENFKKIPVALPKENLLTKYEKIASDMMITISENNRQSQALASLRDYLLPMLMNGQVRVGYS